MITPFVQRCLNSLNEQRWRLLFNLWFKNKFAGHKLVSHSVAFFGHATLFDELFWSCNNALSSTPPFEPVNGRRMKPSCLRFLAIECSSSIKRHSAQILKTKQTRDKKVIQFWDCRSPEGENSPITFFVFRLCLCLGVLHNILFEKSISRQMPRKF